MTRQGFARLATVAALLFVAPAATLAQVAATEYDGATALGLALRQLGNTKRVLMIGAHPDDESTQILGTLALGQGAQVAYLSLTRGEGGQNGIGPELQEPLGLLRSEELLAARRLDGARQYFTRAYDFGFSKNAEEAFLHWPRDSLLADVVAVVRDFRPDVVLSVFSGTPSDGHGQHQAAGIMAREAFDAAADPERFPEQIARGLRPHAAGKLYQSLWRRDDDATVSMETGELDPLFGRSYYQAAMASRSLHRSQDMGQILEPGPQTNALRLMASRVGGEDAGLFAGIDTTVADLAAALARDGGLSGVALIESLRDYERAVKSAREDFNPFRPAELVPALTEGLSLLDAVEEALPGEWLGPVSFEPLADEREELVQALTLAAGLRVDGVADEETVVPGQTFQVTVTLWNGGSRPVSIDGLVPAGAGVWKVEALNELPESIAPGTLATQRLRVTVPMDAEPTEPYFLRLPRDGDMYRWPETVGGVGVPFEEPILQVNAALRLEGVPLGVTRAVSFRGLDKMVGEFRRPLRVVPAIEVEIDPGLAILPLAAAGDPRRFTVRLRSEAPGGISGTLRLHAPDGWTVEPAAVPQSFTAEGEERTVEVSLLAPPEARAGEVRLSAVFEAADGRRFDRGYELVDYPHTQPRPLYRGAATALRVLDVQLPAGLRVGYVAGPGDEVPEALAELGVETTLLGPEALASADLADFDVIVTGIRAYEVRPDLHTHNERLLEYARGGGTLIVQYNKYEYTEPGIAPYPVEMARPHDRVTDETAPVRILDPSHPVFSTPNRISADDFEGWVQERGLYFLHEWDESFTPLLEMADPGEDPLRGSLLVARYGEGTYVYTGLALFRQLPAGVPGAYRLFANLLALGAK